MVFAGSDPYQGFSEECTLCDFQEVVKVAMEHGDVDFLEAIPFMGSAEKRVWYFAKHYGTMWGMDPELILSDDLEQNVPAITFADNPAVLPFLTESLRSIVMDPGNLLRYDAANLAFTLPGGPELPAQGVEHLAVIRNMKLLRERKRRVLVTPLTAIQKDDTKVIRYFLKCNNWTPDQAFLYVAIACNAWESLLVLLEWMKEVPSNGFIIQLVKRDRLDALKAIRSISPDWKPNYDQFDAAISHGHVDILEWCDSINLKIIPSMEALKSAVELGQAEAVMQFLSTSTSEQYRRLVPILSTIQSLKESQI
ncbi:hypothetical protein PSACC_00226 [Paramicrosporidium saccamoebae]|uniref:Uncharacterized protein n=1 Tax=Paramicrosporidium saccamoebae TaxID=1246581 RepID=A0A2H9TQD4_9FUNG|nr:hypothetical protein PSACC_00226 [Paramicrosporidium saccamoebae]